MERLTMLIDSHLLDNGKLDKEYDLNNKIQLNEYSCMDVPNAVYKKLGELEDVLEKYGIESVEELAGLKQKAIVPKFERQSGVYGFAYGLIKRYVVIAYVSNSITLCEDILSNNFEFCDNNYLVSTKEEAEQKLAEIGGKDE